jgi:hypothetical protein
MVPEWVYGTLVALALVHLVTPYFLHARAGRRPADFGADAIEESADEDVVTCLECGTENELEYRFCRSCVTERPGTAVIARSNATTRTGRLS